MMTVRDVAARLRCGLSTAYLLIESGRLQCFRIGPSRGSIRVSDEQLAAYLESCCTQEPNETPSPRDAISRAPLRHLRL